MKNILEYLEECNIKIVSIEGLPARVLVYNNKIIGEIELQKNNAQVYIIHSSPHGTFYYNDSTNFENSKMYNYLRLHKLKPFW